jgi:hypothetical protein
VGTGNTLYSTTFRRGSVEEDGEVIVVADFPGKLNSTMYFEFNSFLSAGKKIMHK